jgi:hypothetical protein
LVYEFLKQYPDARAHQGVGSRLLNSPEVLVSIYFPKKQEVVYHERFGGLLSCYSR